MSIKQGQDLPIAVGPGATFNTPPSLPDGNEAIANALLQTQITAQAASITALTAALALQTLIGVVAFDMNAAPVILFQRGFGGLVVGVSLIRNGVGDYTITLPGSFALGTVMPDLSASIGAPAFLTFQLNGPPSTTIRVLGWNAAGAVDTPSVFLKLWRVG